MKTFEELGYHLESSWNGGCRYRNKDLTIELLSVGGIVRARQGGQLAALTAHEVFAAAAWFEAHGVK